jgi:hypothetical protein
MQLLSCEGCACSQGRCRRWKMFPIATCCRTASSSTTALTPITAGTGITEGSNKTQHHHEVPQAHKGSHGLNQRPTTGYGSTGLSISCTGTWHRSTTTTHSRLVCGRTTIASRNRRHDLQLLTNFAQSSHCNACIEHQRIAHSVCSKESVWQRQWAELRLPLARDLGSQWTSRLAGPDERWSVAVRGHNNCISAQRPHSRLAISCGALFGQRSQGESPP